MFKTFCKQKHKMSDMETRCPLCFLRDLSTISCVEGCKNFTIIGRGAAVFLEGTMWATSMFFPTSKSSLSLIIVEITLSVSSLKISSCRFSLAQFFNICLPRALFQLNNSRFLYGYYFLEVRLSTIKFLFQLSVCLFQFFDTRFYLLNSLS